MHGQGGTRRADHAPSRHHWRRPRRLAPRPRARRERAPLGPRRARLPRHRHGDVPRPVHRWRGPCLRLPHALGGLVHAPSASRVGRALPVARAERDARHAYRARVRARPVRSPLHHQDESQFGVWDAHAGRRPAADDDARVGASLQEARREACRSHQPRFPRVGAQVWLVGQYHADPHPARRPDSPQGGRALPARARQRPRRRQPRGGGGAPGGAHAHLGLRLIRAGGVQRLLPVAASPDTFRRQALPTAAPPVAFPGEANAAGEADG
mmetsp:Transcript_9047/g.23642  ORF Transcript_9047/g.23642 Transcript_9047/m.23642 type:complete len:268 (+) Transcript_9047:1590-2393(+)